MKRVCEECEAEFEQSRRGRPARFCSPRCRSTAWRRNAAAVTADVEPGHNARALEETLRSVDGADPALVQAARSLAAAVDANPKDSPLWGRYLYALEQLRAQVVAHEDVLAAGILAELRDAGPRMP